MRAHYRTIIENLCQDSIANTRRIERLEAENFQMRVKVATLEGMCEGLLDRTKRLEGAEAWVKDCCELVELRAEVERLTAEVEALRNSLGHCAAENATLRENDVLWRSRMKTAEAQVQRVREC